MPTEATFNDGLATRRAVLGDAYVDSALESSSSLDEEFQDFVTRYCWGSVWTDVRLSRRERSLITLAITAALGRPDEFRIHLGGALRNGVKDEELVALLKHIAVYAGVPAAVSGWRALKNVSRNLMDGVPPVSAAQPAAWADGEFPPA